MRLSGMNGKALHQHQRQQRPLASRSATVVVVKAVAFPPQHPLSSTRRHPKPSEAIFTPSSPTLYPTSTTNGGASTSSPRQQQQQPSSSLSGGHLPLELNNVAPAGGGFATSRRRQHPATSGGKESSTLPSSSPSSSSSSGTSLPQPSNAGKLPARIKVAVDVDEVLGRFVHTLNRFCKDHYEMDYREADYSIYEFAKIWNCTQEHSNHIVHEFFKSQHFNDGIPVIPGALEALTRMRSSHDLVVVTSRQHVIQDATLEWIDRHYEGVFEEVYFGNHFALEGVSRRKSEICKSINASVLIDDNPGYAVECAEAGINVLLYDWNLAYPWSKLDKGKMHPLITIVRNWEEVEVAITALSLSSLNPKL